MASFIDSVRTVMGSKNVFFKLLIVSALMSYPLFQVVSQPFKGWGDIWTIVSIVTMIFYVGYLMIASSNLINEETILFPGFLNPFKIFAAGLGGIVAILPMFALMNYAGFSLYDITVQKGMPVQASITIVIIAELLLLGILAVQMMLFANKFNPLHAYNIVKILKSFSDFAVKGIILIIGLAIIAGIVMGPLGYLTYMMFGQGLIFFMVLGLFLTFLLAFATNYWAQLFMENLVLCRKVEYEDDASNILDRDLMIDKDKKF